MALASSSVATVLPVPRESLVSRYPGGAVLYEDDAVYALGTVDTSHTLLARLCGRLDDAAFNTRVIATTRALHRPAHVVALLYLATVLSVFAVEHETAVSAISTASCVLGVALLLYVAASLSWDMLRRLVPTFEFAFLFTVNAFNGALWTQILPDARRGVLLVTGACYVASLCVDANIYTRHLLTRVLVVGSTALPVVLALVVLQYVPHTSNPPINVLDVAIGAVDLQVSGSLIIGFFTMKRVQRTQHLVLSLAPITEIQCDMYMPLCHLVPQAQRHKSRLQSVAELASSGPLSLSQPLQLVDERAAHGIDLTRTLQPRIAAMGTAHPHTLNACGVVAVICFALAPFVQPLDLSPLSLPMLVVSAVALLAALGFTVGYFAHLQPALARRVALEIDAWFVSLHMTLVAVCVADLQRWDAGRLLWPCTAWLWCHWVLFLDAVPPPARRRIAFSRKLPLLVTALLFVYPIMLTYYVYLSAVRHELRNRVVLELAFGQRQRLHVDVLGFLASRLFTLWVWTGRFLWRELARPADAYRLLKRRVAYRVPVWR